MKLGLILCVFFGCKVHTKPAQWSCKHSFSPLHRCIAEFIIKKQCCFDFIFTVSSFELVDFFQIVMKITHYYKAYFPQEINIISLNIIRNFCWNNIKSFQVTAIFLAKGLFLIMLIEKFSLKDLFKLLLVKPFFRSKCKVSFIENIPRIKPKNTSFPN